MSAVNFIYKSVFRRTSTFVFAIVVSSFFFERTVDLAADSYFEYRNKGKLWKDIKHKYES